MCDSLSKHKRAVCTHLVIGDVATVIFFFDFDFFSNNIGCAFANFSHCCIPKSVNLASLCFGSLYSLETLCVPSAWRKKCKVTYLAFLFMPCFSFGRTVNVLLFVAFFFSFFPLFTSSSSLFVLKVVLVVITALFSDIFCAAETLRGKSVLFLERRNAFFLEWW